MFIEAVETVTVVVMLTILHKARLSASLGRARVQALSGRPMPPGVRGITVKGSEEAKTSVPTVPSLSKAEAMTPKDITYSATPTVEAKTATAKAP